MTLHNEAHARPPEELPARARISYLAVYSTRESGERQRRQITALCERFGARAPDESANHFSADLGPFRLKWERHTEFARYKFIVKNTPAKPFDEPAIDVVPREFVENIEGELIAAAHVVLLPRDDPVFESEAGIDACCGNNPLVGADVAAGDGTAWTDFRVHADGFSRWLIRDTGMTPRQRGRTVQRLLEIDTYRLLALLALPVANSLTPRLNQYDEELAGITGALTEPSSHEESDLLERLTRLQVKIENDTTRSAYRFAAARAYHDLVQRRVRELREKRLSGLQTFGEFIERRLAPAMNTCESVAARLASLLTRVSRTTHLLSTRVDIMREEQTQALLESMNRRAKMQLRLQQTVEGLSVAAITYYIVGLVGYAAKGLDSAGLPLDVDLATAISIPVVVTAVAFGVRSIRSTVSRKLNRSR